MAKHTLYSLEQAMKRDLLDCQSDFERGNCEGMCLGEMRERALEIQKERQLTTGELQVLERNHLLPLPVYEIQSYENPK